MIDPHAYTSYRWVRRGCRRKRILLFLHGRKVPVKGMAVSCELGIGIKRVSDTLIELRKHGLVRVRNPKAWYGREYVLTKTGKLIGRYLRKQ